MTNAYQLKPWTQVVTPHQDILDGKLDMSTYAVNLGAVIRKAPTCPAVYRDAREFFNATYLTVELKKLLKEVLGSLRGDAGDRVLQLRTPFGGGKTHSLVSLYHIAQHRSAIQDFPELSGLPDPGPVKVAAFIGLDMDVSVGIQIENGPHILTPWGYLAWELGGPEAYALVATQDQQRIAPGNDVLRQVLGDRANLLLIDEFLVYVENAMGLSVGDSNFGRQVLTFIQKLTEVVSGSSKTVLVYSLQASVQEALGDEGLLGVLDKLVSRIDAKKEPVSGDEVMRVIQRRLFADIGDPAVIQEIARQQSALLRKFRESYEETTRGKQEAQQQADLLAERIQISYPFHPDLLDLMYHRWGSLPSYQRTRGALQFLARVVYALYQANDASLLIGPGNIPFQDEGVRGAFFSQVGERERFVTVIEADLVGRKAKVKMVDQRIAQDAPALNHLKVGTQLASAILMYSFGVRSGEDRGVIEQEVTASCLATGLDRTTLTATLSDLREQLLYLHYVGRRYRFETKPNLNKLIVDEESKVAAEEVLLRIREDLSKSLQETRGKIVLWPRDSAAIADHLAQFMVVYLDPDWAQKDQEVVFSEVSQWLEKRGNSKREYVNGLCFVVPKKSEIDKSRKGARTTLAIQSLIKDKAKYGFTPEDIEELTAKGKDAANEVSAGTRRMYDYILLPMPDLSDASPVKLEALDLQSQLNTSQNLQDRVLDALKNHVFDSLTPTKLVGLCGMEEASTQYITGDELLSYFFRFPNYPKVLDGLAIKKALIKAIEQGQLGYVPHMNVSEGIAKVEKPSLVTYKRAIPTDELDLAGYVLSSSLAEQLATPPALSSNAGGVEADQEKEEEKTLDVGQSSGQNDRPVNKFEPPNSTVSRTVLTSIINGQQSAHSYTLKVLVDKVSVFTFFDILQTLSDKADEMTVEITVRASTKKTFDPVWVRNAIEEPLDEADIKASTRLE